MKIYIKKSLSANFELLDTPDQSFAKGGQARVYKIVTKGYEDYCLKKYTKEEDARRNYDRIGYMIQYPPKNIMSSQSFRICWPTAFAYDMQKNFIGYVMPLAFAGSRDLKILEVYNAKPISQRAKYKKYPDWFDKYELDTDSGLKNRMKMLCNWAIAIYSIHETHKYVIVDLKPENVAATSSGKISIVDTDSFQISENGKILFPGTAYTPGYFPPEGKLLKQRNAPFTISCDCFAAAVCFYKILTGVHPFGGTIKKSPYDQLETEEDFINAGLFAYGDKRQYLSFNPNFNLHKHFENLSPAIQVLFERAFGRDANVRPTMDEWGKALRESATSTVKLLRTTVKPPKTNSLSIQIVSARFCDGDFHGNIIRNYGDKLYTDVSYLMPEIIYKVLRPCSSLEIRYKIYSPSGVLLHGASSMPGFTTKSQISCPSCAVYTSSLLGWGNDAKDLYSEPGTWRVEFYEGDKCLYKTSVEIHKAVVTPPPYVPPVNNPVNKPVSQPYSPFINTSQKSKSGSRSFFKWAIGIVLCIVIFMGIKKFWYDDYKQDADFPRFYVYANNLNLRSSKLAVDSNQVGMVPYGTELVVYSNEGGWAYVKADGQKGYVSSDYLLGSEDFALLDGVWGNEESKEMVETSKCRLAVLDFLKTNGLPTGSDGWQIFTKLKDVKPNSVAFPRLNDGYDDFTEFAFILKNNATNQQKLALYAFTTDEKPVFRHSEDAPENACIKSVSYTKRKDAYRVTYAQGGVSAPAASVKKVVIAPLEIQSVSFANSDYHNDILTGFGEQLYTDMQYLCAKFSYRKESSEATSMTFQMKIFDPKGTLLKGKSSPAGYTREEQLTLYGKSGTCQTGGWGSSKGNVYLPGVYRYEIWHAGKKLHASEIIVKEKPLAKEDFRITSVAFGNLGADGQVLAEYGSQLYSDIQYLRPRFLFQKDVPGVHVVTLQVKIFNPDGTLKTGNGSPAGYTYDEEEVVLDGASGFYGLTCWGNKDATSYPAGKYRFEIWWKGTRLSSSVINVKPK